MMSLVNACALWFKRSISGPRARLDWEERVGLFALVAGSLVTWAYGGRLPPVFLVGLVIRRWYTALLNHPADGP